MFLGKTRRIHFIGIGGSGMSGIAEVLKNMGYEVTGSDRSKSRVTDHLESLGVRVHEGHRADNVENAQVVVVSTAIDPSNVEVAEARERMIPVIPRAEMLAELMRMKYGIAVAGTHGKTTTTSLVASVLDGGRLDPTVVIGGRLKSASGHSKLGQSEFLVAEADESDGSFLKLSPAIAVITTLDEEHMDYYKTLDGMKQAFLSFINKVPFYGAAVLCLDDANLQSLIPGIEKRIITYGLTAQADVTAKNISLANMLSRFTVIHQGKELGPVASRALGHHNVQNTLAAVAVGLELGIAFADIARAIENFSGVQRRFEIVHQSDRLILVDDYGHHPVEIQATLKTARQAWPDRRLIVVFQPHRYSRTKWLLESFWRSFNDADRLIVTDIYPGGEAPIEGVHARHLAEGVKESGHKNVEYLPGLEEAAARLAETLAPGDVVITLGAGDVGEVNRHLLSLCPDESKHP
ncbi:MAG: UDP-N-acetylmuramate--L-alanine ligase [Nitrospinaceae bacterium]|nr:MAG: UDP-N-acetylmuramate--L-alanine ligase [Nitrospinaceae bacterium]